jgi:hypothetical protein
LHAGFARISRGVEAVQFGSVTPTKERWQVFFEEVNRIVGRTTLLLLVSVSVMFSTGCRERLARTSALGCGENPGGHSVLCELLRVDGAEVRRRIEKVDAIDEDVAQIIVLPGTDLSESEWNVLDAWVREGHTLVLAGSLTPLHEKLEVRLDHQRCHEPSELTEGSQILYGKGTRLATIREWPFDTAREDAWSIATCEQGPTVLGVKHGDAGECGSTDQRFHGSCRQRALRREPDVAIGPLRRSVRRLDRIGIPESSRGATRCQVDTMGPATTRAGRFVRVVAWAALR